MPAIGTRLRRLGLAVNNRIEGDSVTFRGAALVCVIHWTPIYGEEHRELGEIRMDDRTQTTIEVRFANLATAPRTNEYFVDADGMHHRIQRIRQTDSTWFCFCDVEDAE